VSRPDGREAKSALAWFRSGICVSASFHRLRAISGSQLGGGVDRRQIARLPNRVLREAFMKMASFTAV
jgi:hypothetical protein